MSHGGVVTTAPLRLEFALPTTAPTLRLKPGQSVVVKVDGEDAVLIGTYPDGWAAMVSPRQFAIFNERSYGLLRYTHGGAVMIGHRGAVELLNSIRPQLGSCIQHLNGLSLDLRPSNVVIVPDPLAISTPPHQHRRIHC